MIKAIFYLITIIFSVLVLYSWLAQQATGYVN
jgi:hypothetical protein